MYIFPSPISHEWNNRSGSIKETRVLACYGREKISNNRAIFVHFLYYFPTVFIDNFLEQYSSRALSKRDILRKLVKKREELYIGTATISCAINIIIGRKEKCIRKSFMSSKYRHRDILLGNTFHDEPNIPATRKKKLSLLCRTANETISR